MIPPTPTLVPAGTPIPLDVNVDMWDMSPNIVGLWNQFNAYTPVLQVMIVGGLLIFLIWTLGQLLRKVSEEEA